jgi:RNA-splicing ligase RtcB
MDYEVSDNLVPFEEYNLGDRVLNLCVHRKHATRGLRTGARRVPLLTARCTPAEMVAEEPPVAYKDVFQVVKACEGGAGSSTTGAGLRPIGVVKG